MLNRTDSRYFLNVSIRILYNHSYCSKDYCYNGYNFYFHNLTASQFICPRIVFSNPIFMWYYTFDFRWHFIIIISGVKTSTMWSVFIIKSQSTARFYFLEEEAIFLHNVFLYRSEKYTGILFHVFEVNILCLFLHCIYLISFEFWYILINAFLISWVCSV